MSDSTKAQKPENEIVVTFKKNDDGSVVVTFFDIHGSEAKAGAQKAGLPLKAFNDKAAELTAKIGQLAKALGYTERKSFNTKGGKQYWSIRKPIAA